MILGKGGCSQSQLSSLCGGSVHHPFFHKNRDILRCTRGRRAIVASGPAKEAPVISNEPLTKDDLIHYMVSGCKPKEEWRYKITIHDLSFIFICNTRYAKCYPLKYLYNFLRSEMSSLKIIETRHERCLLGFPFCSTNKIMGKTNFENGNKRRKNSFIQTKIILKTLFVETKNIFNYKF